MPDSAFVSRLRRAAKGLGDFLYGMTVHDMIQLPERERSAREQLFLLTNFGELVGAPILPSYYALSLLPYAAPKLDAWRRRLLRPAESSFL